MRRSVRARSSCTRRQPGAMGSPEGGYWMLAVPGKRSRSPHSVTHSSMRAWYGPMSKPCSASATAGSMTTSSGRLPYCSNASSRPATKPGVATASGPNREARSGSPGCTYMSRLAAAGAVSRASSARISPFGRRISRKAPPPTPAEKGWVTARANAEATAASTALPPPPQHGDTGLGGVALGGDDHAVSGEHGRPRRRIGGCGEQNQPQ